MSMSNLARLAAIIVLFGCCQISRADITVRFDPVESIVDLGNVFTVDIVADIPVADAVLGWGLDLDFDDSIISQVVSPAIGSSWMPSPTLDGDGLGGLAFPFSISGTDITLATMTFSADGLGISDLIASTTLGDATEGFALDPLGFANVTFEAGQVMVIPAPGACVLGLIGLGLVHWTRRRLPR